MNHLRYDCRSLSAWRLFLVSLVDGLRCGDSWLRCDSPCSTSGSWPPPGMPGLSKLLIVSTIVIVYFQRHDGSGLPELQREMALAATALKSGGSCPDSCFLGVAFLVVQTIVMDWKIGSKQHLDISEHLYAWSFYVLTGLHAAARSGWGDPACSSWLAESFKGGYTRTQLPRCLPTWRCTGTSSVLPGLRFTRPCIWGSRG